MPPLAKSGSFSFPILDFSPQRLRFPPFRLRLGRASWSPPPCGRVKNFSPTVFSPPPDPPSSFLRDCRRCRPFAFEEYPILCPDLYPPPPPQLHTRLYRTIPLASFFFCASPSAEAGVDRLCCGRWLLPFFFQNFPPIFLRPSTSAFRILHFFFLCGLTPSPFHPTCGAHELP